MAESSPLHPDLVARLSSLSLRARMVVDGVLTGLHRSPHHGSSIEFAEHKEYAPGDDIRHLDWKALARFDRLYIKKYEDETNLRAFLMLDASASMAYGDAKSVTKFEYAKILTAALMYLLHIQQDAAGLTFFAGAIRRTIPPRASAKLFQDGLFALQQVQADGETNFGGVFSHMAQMMSGRNLVVIVSDLLDISEEDMRLMQQLKQRRNDVALFHVLHRDELTFPFDSLTRFESMEDERFALAEPQAMRHAYIEAVEEFIDATRKTCNEVGIDYNLAVSDMAYDEVLVPFLRRRMRR